MLGKPVVDGLRVTIPIDPGSATRWFRQNVFRVQYSGLESLDPVDDAILVVPALGTVLTLAYACGVPVQVERVDGAYAVTAQKLADTFGRLYPHFLSRGFELRGERVGTPGPDPERSDPALLLYSGGADSTSSLIEHSDDVRALLTVWGADVHSADKALWERLLRTVRTGELTAGRRLVVARSNLQDLIDGPALSRYHAHGFDSASWWGAVQHGLALTSLAVPVAVALGLPRVLIASSDMAGTPVPWGSMPIIEDEVRWSGGRAENDQPELSRTEKITRVIAPYLHDGGRLALAVCYQPSRGPSGLNCGRCEKCVQTTTQLLLGGVDPREVGMPTSPQTFAVAKKALTRGEWHGDDSHRTIWRSLQADVPPTLTGVCAIPLFRDYLEWLRHAKIVISSDGAEPLTRLMIKNAQYLGGRLLPWLPFRFRKRCTQLAVRLTRGY